MGRMPSHGSDRATSAMADEYAEISRNRQTLRRSISQDGAVRLAPEAAASASRIAPEVRKSSARHVRHCPRPVRILQDEPIPIDPAPTQVRGGWARKTAMQDARTSWP